MSSAGDVAAVMAPRRLAYADPPYPDLAGRYYGDHPDFGGEVDHAALVEQLVEFDGWALSTSARALPDVLRVCPPGVRVGAWHRGAAEYARSPYALNAWEPVIYVPVPVRLSADVSRRDLADLSRSAEPDLSHPDETDLSRRPRAEASRLAIVDPSHDDDVDEEAGDGLVPGRRDGLGAAEHDTSATVMHDGSTPAFHDAFAGGPARRLRSGSPRQISGLQPRRIGCVDARRIPARGERCPCRLTGLWVPAAADRPGPGGRR